MKRKLIALILVIATLAAITISASAFGYTCSCGYSSKTNSMVCPRCGAGAHTDRDKPLDSYHDWINGLMKAPKFEQVQYENIAQKYDLVPVYVGR